MGLSKIAELLTNKNALNIGIIKVSLAWRLDNK